MTSARRRRSQIPKLMKRILFGVSNIPLGAQIRNIENIERILTECASRMSDFSLKVLELPFNEVYMDPGRILERLKVDAKEKSPQELLEIIREYLENIYKEVIKKSKIHLWVYGPKYVDFISSEAAEKFTMEALEMAAAFASMIKADGLVTLLGYAGDNRKESLKKSIKMLREIRDLLLPSQYIGIEIPGKKELLGATLSEIKDALSSIDRSIPVINLAHYYALAGGILRRAEQFLEPIKYLYRESHAKDFIYIKISGIEVSDNGERLHMPLITNQPPLNVVIDAIYKFLVENDGVKAYVIVESPLLEYDAEYFMTKLKEYFEGVSRRASRGSSSGR
ncbi:MAG: hypothetical protein DRN26_04750 [Thermoplasmata archaeon]|nr:MAG: hypothetical protein DRN26_04750 [Thermoplasmata archaeon]